MCIRDRNSTIHEKELVSGIFGGIKTKLSWTNENQFLSWFEAKGKMETFLKQLNFKNYWQPGVNQTVKDLFHPYRSATIRNKNLISLGNFGQIHPVLANQLNLPVELYLFEFDLEVFQTQIQNSKLILHQEYTTYPKTVSYTHLTLPTIYSV